MALWNVLFGCGMGSIVFIIVILAVWANFDIDPLIPLIGIPALILAAVIFFCCAGHVSKQNTTTETTIVEGTVISVDITSTKTNGPTGSRERYFTVVRVEGENRTFAIDSQLYADLSYELEKDGEVVLDVEKSVNTEFGEVQPPRYSIAE